MSNKLDVTKGSSSSSDRADMLNMTETRSIATVTDPPLLHSEKVQQNSHNDDNVS